MYKTKQFRLAFVIAVGIAIAGFFVFFARGGTVQNLTLTTNTDLENGLINHWTFDGKDMDWATEGSEVLDRGSNGVDGWATTTWTPAADVSYVGTGNTGELSNGDCNPVSECQWSYNHSSGNLLVAVFNTDDATLADMDISSVTYNSVPMTQVVERLVDGHGSVEIWYLENPATGSNTLQWSQAGKITDLVVGAVSMNNYGGVGTSNSTTGTSATPSVSVTGVEASSIVVDGIVSDDRNPISLGGSGDNRNARWNIDVGSEQLAGSTEDPASDGTVTMDWSTSNDLYVMAAAEFSIPADDQDPHNVPGKLGQGMEFDGTYDYVDIGDAYPLTAGTAKTIAFWVNADDATSESIMDFDGTDEITTNGSDQITLTLAGAAITQYYVDGVPGARVITDGKWHHVVVTDTGGTDPSNMDIGRIGSNYFGGRIDDVRTYSKVLTATEVERLYHLGATTKIGKTLTTFMEDNLVLHYPFDGMYLDTASSTGEIVDARGSEIQLDWIEHATTTVLGPAGNQAITFDGTDDGIDYVGEPCGGCTFKTMSLWLKYENKVGNNEPIVSQTSSYMLSIISDVVTTSAVDDIYVNGESGTSVTEDTWYHVVSSASANRTTTDLQFGFYNIDFSISGIDDVRFYDVQFSASDAQRLYESYQTTHINKTLTTNPDLFGAEGGDSSMVLHHTFDGPDIDTSQTSAEIRDKSPNSVHGNLTGIFDPKPGKIGQAIDGSGGSSAYDIASGSLPTGDFTYSFWINPSADFTRSLIGSTFLSSSNFELGITRTSGTGYITGLIDVSTSLTNTAEGADVGRWSHVVFRREGSTVSLFVNGISGSTISDGDTLSFECNLDVMQISTGGSGSCEFGGVPNALTSFDDFRIYSRALSDTEIERLYGLGR